MDARTIDYLNQRNTRDGINVRVVELDEAEVAQIKNESSEEFWNGLAEYASNLSTHDDYSLSLIVAKLEARLSVLCKERYEKTPMPQLRGRLPDLYCTTKGVCCVWVESEGCCNDFAEDCEFPWEVLQDMPIGLREKFANVLSIDIEESLR